MSKKVNVCEFFIAKAERSDNFKAGLEILIFENIFS